MLQRILKEINSPKLTSDFSMVLLKYVVFILLIITVLIIFTPINPNMPNSGLDPSWRLSVNEAMVQNLKMGEEFIFTFGPYSALSTQLYHPRIDDLIFFSGLFLGVCYAASLVYVLKGKSVYLVFAFLIFFSGLIYVKDSLFFSYPLLLMSGVYKFIVISEFHGREKLNPWWMLIIAIVFTPLGLLPLIKGSFLLISGFVSILISLCFYYYRYRLLAFISIMAPIISSIVFWELSGQLLVSLPSYFVNMSEIISGYTEAMAIEGKSSEIFVYLLGSTIVIWLMLKKEYLVMPMKIFIGLSLLLFLFVSFKSGFTRHDNHALIAVISLVFVFLLVITFSIEKKRLILLIIPLVAWVYVSSNYIDNLVLQTVKNMYHTYDNAWSGVILRVNGGKELQSKFEYSLGEIRKEYAIPSLQGTSDIYPYDQSYLIASDNDWNPRPIIQSYSAYTPKLAEFNEGHLRGGRAPDNVFFSIKPIDERLPSLDDGLSWPALFDNYSLITLNNDMAYFHKNQMIKGGSDFDIIHEGEYKIKENVKIPKVKAPVYAKINIKQTLLGKLLNAIFKSPQLKMVLIFENGTKKEYRILSRMMSSGFFISPFIGNTREFVLLATGNQHFLGSNKIESFSIEPSYGDSVFWNFTYSLEMKTFNSGKGYGALPDNLFDDMIDFIRLFGNSRGEPQDIVLTLYKGLSPRKA